MLSPTISEDRSALAALLDGFSTAARVTAATADGHRDALVALAVALGRPLPAPVVALYERFLGGDAWFDDGVRGLVRAKPTVQRPFVEPVVLLTPAAARAQLEGARFPKGWIPSDLLPIFASPTQVFYLAADGSILVLGGDRRLRPFAEDLLHLLKRIQRAQMRVARTALRPRRPN